MTRTLTLSMSAARTSFPLRERERDLRRRLREVAGRHGLEEHGEDLGPIREQLRHVRRPRPAERREHAGVAVERGARRVRAFCRELHGRHGAARGQAVVEEHLAAARAGPFVVAGRHVRGERERSRRLLLVQAEELRAGSGSGDRPDGAGRAEDLRDLDVHDHAADFAADLVAGDERREEILAARVRVVAASDNRAGTSTVPKWLTLPTCMSSRTSPWLNVPFANAAS